MGYNRQGVLESVYNVCICPVGKLDSLRSSSLLVR